MKSLIRKNLTGCGNNTIYAMRNTYKIFYKNRRKKFDINLAIIFIISMLAIILIFWWLYETA